MLKTVIPARAGSKRIPHKNVRLLNGKPLIAHAIEAALGEIIVDTDDPEVRSIALALGVNVVERDPFLATDNATIDDLVASYLPHGGTLMMLQPTILHRNLPRIVENFYEAFTEQDGKAWTLGVPIRHLIWSGGSAPLWRVNSQLLAPEFTQEIGCRLYAEGVTDSTPYDVFPVEGLYDIDTHEDLAAVRVAMGDGRVFFRVVANSTLGSGHLFRCLRLAAELDHHAVGFHFVGSAPGWAKERVSPWPLIELPQDLDGAVVINDTLDTSEIEIGGLKARGAKVICLEDGGPGSRLADLVINAMYASGTDSNERVGSKWAVIRPEFIVKRPFTVSGKWRVLVTFGGTDPAHLTERAIEELQDLPAEVRIIEPPGRQIDNPDLVTTPSMAAEMAWADLIVTSGGRTVYEAAAIGRPVITIFQNPREGTHAHLDSVINLGLASLLSPGRMREVVVATLSDTSLLYDLSVGQALDGRGAQRIAAEVEAML